MGYYHVDQFRLFLKSLFLSSNEAIKKKSRKRFIVCFSNDVHECEQLGNVSNENLVPFHFSLSMENTLTNAALFSLHHIGSLFIRTAQSPFLFSLNSRSTLPPFSYHFTVLMPTS